MMFLIPLCTGNRFGKRAGWTLKLASLSGLCVTVLAAGFSLFPVIDVPNRVLFGVKVIAATVAVNLVGAFVYWQSRGQSR